MNAHERRRALRRTAGATDATRRDFAAVRAHRAFLAALARATETTPGVGKPRARRPASLITPTP